MGLTGGWMRSAGEWMWGAEDGWGEQQAAITQSTQCRRDVQVRAGCGHTSRCWEVTAGGCSESAWLESSLAEGEES